MALSVGARPWHSAPEYLRPRRDRKASQAATVIDVFLLSHPYDTLVGGDGDFPVAPLFCQMSKNGSNAVHQHVDATFIWVETVRLVELRILRDTP